MARNNGGRSNSRGQDAIALLRKDHKTFKSLLKKLETADDRNTRSNLLRQIEHELTVHAQIEEEIFFPAFRNAIRSENDKERYFEAIEELHVVDSVMPEVSEEGLNSEKFAAKSKVLKDLIEHHAEEEESLMFPKAKRVMGVALLRELGAELHKRKEQISTGMWDRALGMLNPFAHKTSNATIRHTERGTKGRAA